jgi:hypothetical protein
MQMIKAGWQFCASLFASVLSTWGGALVVLVVGALLAIVVQWVVGFVFGAGRLDKFAKNRTVASLLSRGDIKKSLGELIGSGLFYLILAATFVLALERAGAGDIRSSAVSLLAFLPRVASALLVGFLGALLSEIAAGVVRVTAGNIGLRRRDFWGSLTQYAILAFAGVLALQHLGVFQWLGPMGRDLFVGAVCFVVALAFGLAGKESAGKVISALSNQFADEKKHR